MSRAADFMADTADEAEVAMVSPDGEQLLRRVRELLMAITSIS